MPFSLVQELQRFVLKSSQSCCTDNTTNTIIVVLKCVFKVLRILKLMYVDYSWIQGFCLGF